MGLVGRPVKALGGISTEPPGTGIGILSPGISVVSAGVMAVAAGLVFGLVIGGLYLYRRNFLYPGDSGEDG